MASEAQEPAAETVALLQAAGVQLALAEAGMDGTIAQLLSGAEGAQVLTRERSFATPEELALALRVSPAKVAAFGALSAMVAAEAAAELIDTYEGGWGLVVMVAPWNRDAGPGVQRTAAGSAPGFVALGTPSVTVIQQSGVDSIVRVALELLREQAQRRLNRA